MNLSKNSPMQKLLDTLPQIGKITWIGIRHKRNIDLESLTEVALIKGKGLEGDHFSSQTSDKRQVTLIQYEHIQAVASFLGKEIHPNLLRRNIVVQGINLLALKDKQFQIGEAILEMTDLCHPCSRMEENLGAGGYNAMRGHGGITARIIQGGKIKLGDSVHFHQIQDEK